MSSIFGKTISYFIERLCLVLLLFNIIYIGSCYLRFSSNGISLQEDATPQKNIDYESNEQTAEVSNNNIDYGLEIEQLIADAKADKDTYWLLDTEQKGTKLEINPYEFLNDTTDKNAWINKDTIFQDHRLTLSLYLNYIRHEYNAGKSLDKIEVPFNWADWIDLSVLNTELSKPIPKRRGCNWCKKFTLANKAVDNTKLRCLPNDEVTPSLLNSLGFSRHEQLPGFLNLDYSPFFAHHKVRLLQAKTYLYTFMPNPRALMFLNKNGGTYEVSVESSQQRSGILKSGMMRHYMKTKLQNGNVMKNLKSSVWGSKITLDPIDEFKQLIEEVPSITIRQNEHDDPAGIYRMLHDDDSSKTLSLTPSMFHYNQDTIISQISEYEKMASKRKLTSFEKGYLESLVASRDTNTHTEHTYFKQATLDARHDKMIVNKDFGYHYDWRFFDGALEFPRPGWSERDLNMRTSIMIDRLLRTWVRFTQEKGLISWIMHGPLLAWFWNGLMFPFDDDLDVQMPASELARLGELHNQTLVFEDIEEGFGKYLVDVGTYIHNRDISRRANHIDARFIDVDTGVYIDITGLAASDETPNKEFYDSGIIKEEDTEVYNDRRKHWYTFDQLSPLRLSTVDGTPTFIPNDISGRLSFEYPRGLTLPEFFNWHFIPKLQMWLRQSDLLAVFDENSFAKIIDDNKVDVDKKKVMGLILDMSDEEVFKILKSDDGILSDYILTKEFTDAHKKEMEFMFSHYEENGKVSYKPNEKLSMDQKFHEQYKQFVNKNMIIHTPRRKSLFSFEKSERAEHSLK